MSNNYYDEIRLDYESEVEAKKQVGLIFMILAITMDLYRNDCLSPAALEEAYKNADLTADPIYTFVNTNYHSEIVQECQKSFKSSIKLERFDAKRLCSEIRFTQKFVKYMHDTVDIFKAIELGELMSKTKLEDM